MSVDPNDAPVGYKAVPYTTCRDCHFDGQEQGCLKRIMPSCLPGVRKDGHSAMFVTAEARLPFTPWQLHKAMEANKGNIVGLYAELERIAKENAK